MLGVRSPLLVGRAICVCPGVCRFVSAMSNPKCYFDITAGGKGLGRITMEVMNGVLRHVFSISSNLFPLYVRLFQLYADVTPKTAGIVACSCWFVTFVYMHGFILLRIQRTSAPSALERKDSDTRGRPSTVSSPTSCARFVFAANLGTRGPRKKGLLHFIP